MILFNDLPGHVQSGQYLWPAAAFTGRFLIDNWSTLNAETVVELGAGVGLAGLIASKLPGTKEVVLTDYDHGSLQLLNDNVELNRSREDTCQIGVEFLEWGKTLKRVNNCISSSKNSSDEISIINSDDDYECKNASSSSSVGETFSLVLGTDLLYCTEIVRPLFKSAKLLMNTERNTRFILVSSFNPGEEIESLKIICCKELGLMRHEILQLDEIQKNCRVEYFEHLQP